MANRYPLIVDTTSGNQIKELPAGDNLNLTGNGLIGVTSLSVVTGISSATMQTSGNATVGGTLSVTGSATVTGSISTNANLDVTGIIRINNVNILELVDWDDLNNVPVFADVAFSGSYDDLLDVPNLATVATSGSYNDLSNRPTLATVATTGNYFSLSNRPTIPSDLSQLTDNTGVLDKSFLDLSDTPGAYSGQGGKFVQVSPSENGLQFSDTSVTITSGDVIAALGYTPYSSANPSNYISVESDTLDSVTDRGSTTTNSVTVGSLSSTGEVSGSSLKTSGNILFDTNSFVTIDSQPGGTITVGGDADLQLKSQNAIVLYNSILPDTSLLYDLGSEDKYFSNGYFNDTVFHGNLQGAPGKTNITIGAAGNINITAGAATNRVSIFTGVFNLPNYTTTQRNALTPQLGDIIYNNSTSQVQVYVAIAGYNTGEPFAGWVNLYNPPAP